jgi:hypothetical protein
MKKRNFTRKQAVAGILELLENVEDDQWFDILEGIGVIPEGYGGNNIPSSDNMLNALGITTEEIKSIEQT